MLGLGQEVTTNGQPMTGQITPHDVHKTTSTTSPSSVTKRYIETGCQSKALTTEKEVAAALFKQALASSTLPWQLKTSESTSTREAYVTAYSHDQLEYLLPCQYVMSYGLTNVSSTTIGKADGLSNRLSNLVDASWRSDLDQKYVSTSTGMSVEFMLNDSGGPGGYASEYSLQLPEQRAVQFLNLSDRFRFAHDLSADDRCPCSETVSIGVSNPVKLEEMTKPQQ